MIAFNLPPFLIEIADGDIAAETTDAIVNAANNALWMGAGVAGALKARGGASIEAEAMAQGPVAPGECVVTTAGRLRVITPHASDALTGSSAIPRTLRTDRASFSSTATSISTALPVTPSAASSSTAAFVLISAAASASTTTSWPSFSFCANAARSAPRSTVLGSVKS